MAKAYIARLNSAGKPAASAPRKSGNVTLKPSIAAAKQDGFATFNEGPHLCIDVPNGNYTITCRTSTGKLVTMSFVPYQNNGPAGCVDIKHENSKLPVVKNGDVELHPFHSIGFSKSGDVYDTRRTAHAPTLITVLLADKHYSTDGKE